ncbi:MAG: hypothetical protein ABIJ41_03870 [Candidatus Omnitrophota bacterium]
MQKLRKRRAQTATELAIFGSILIFVLGSIVRSAMSYNYANNQALKAMRLAFKASYASSETQAAGRNMASILMIEDRKDVESGSDKYGSLRRVPYAIGSAGSFTRNLFMNMKYDPDHRYSSQNLPRFDVFINGRHFEFTTAAFDELWIFNVDDTSHPTYWNNPDYYNACQEVKNVRILDPCVRGLPCLVAYKKLIRDDKKFCSPVGPTIPGTNDCPAEADKMGSLADRFDLDRDGNGPDVPVDLQGIFAWQWLPVRMTTRYVEFENGDNLSVDIDCDLEEEQIIWTFDETDIKKSLYEEEENEANCSPMVCLDIWIAGARIEAIRYIDRQNGDINLTYKYHNEMKGEPSPGMKQGMTLYGLTKGERYRHLDDGTIKYEPGTYFRIEEDKLFSGKQYIRHARKSDRVDIIERKVQLSNDTGNICDDGINPNVEVCCPDPKPANPDCSPELSCCYGDNTWKTCFDRNCKMLYVRSKITDKTGVKWVTDTSGDEMLIK